MGMRRAQHGGQGNSRGLARGSIRARFVLGTAGLMVLVLVGLIAVIITHARQRIEEQTQDAMRTLVVWTVGVIELGLPDGVETLGWDMLRANSALGFEADTLLHLNRLLDDLTDQGLAEFAIADRDNVVLVSLDLGDLGTLASPLRRPDEVDVYSERPSLLSLGEWAGEPQRRIHAAAPVRNRQGERVGSVRLTAGTQEIQAFARGLRDTLAAVGAAIILVGLGVSWWLTTPLVQAAHRLAAHAAGVGRGEYTLFEGDPRRPERGALGRRSIRTRLTVALVVLLALLVGVLELVAIPIERRQAEDRLKDGLVAAAEWIGQAASVSLESSQGSLSLDEQPALVELLDSFEGLNQLGRQDLTGQRRQDDLAYVALVDNSGTIRFSQPPLLVGDQVSEDTVPKMRTQLVETTWRDAEVWVVSTPLKREESVVGYLQMAVRPIRVEEFLAESHTRFRLTGLIAVLAGILLAQVIGGAVTAPVRELAAGARRVGQGDTSVRFEVHSNDELAILANAYNQMVTGLQEREWLRDMFGRFVSPEVAEALRNEQVRLQGEHRVVSVLFCDMRDFTPRSEKHTPEEMVALLNEYLAVVVGAARHHQGTVNKFGGDSALIIYGAPRQLRESAYQAVLTALELRFSLKALNAQLIERGQAPIRIGVGISTGEVLAGAVGPEERQEYTVIGDPVNLASRIEDLTKLFSGYDVLISGETYQALGARRAGLELVDLGEHGIRGKAQPVHVWAVVNQRGGTTVRI